MYQISLRSSVAAVAKAAQSPSVSIFAKAEAEIVLRQLNFAKAETEILLTQVNFAQAEAEIFLRRNHFF